MFFKERFESLALFQKIEIVLIVFIVYGGIVYYVDNFKVFMDEINKVKVQTATSLNISQKMQKISQNEALQFVQKRLVELSIENSSLVVQNKQLSIEFMDTFEKTFQLLRILENHFKIESLSIVPKDNQLKVQILFNTRYLFNKDREEVNSLELENPFYIKKEPKKVKLEKTQEDFQIPTFEIDAILGDEVLINQQWYSIGEIIENNKIIKIENDRVLFENLTQRKDFYIKYTK